MHIVIIYENTGGGHKKLANILAEYLQETNIHITLVTTSELVKEKGNVFVAGWNYFIKKNWLFVADVLLNFISRIFLLPFYYSIYANTLFRSLDELKPDKIISTADVNRLFGSYCKSRKIPFFICITSGSIFIDMLSIHAKHIVYLEETAKVIRHIKLTGYFKRDITPTTSWPNRISDIIKLLVRYSVGYLINPYFLQYSSDLQQKNQMSVYAIGPIREKYFYQKKSIISIKNLYNVPIGNSCVLISSGSLGGSFVLNIIKSIAKNNNNHIKQPLSLIAICGKDTKLYQQLLSFKPNINIQIVPICYTNSLADLYHIADCSIGRGTAGILMDSIVSKTPLIVFNKVTTNDYGTLNMIRNHRIGEIAYSCKQIPKLLSKILSNQSFYKQAIEKLTHQYNNINPNVIELRIKKIILEESYD